MTIIYLIKYNLIKPKKEEDTKFPQMKKSDVNGENELPLFRFLKDQKGFEGFGKGPAAKMADVASCVESLL